MYMHCTSLKLQHWYACYSLRVILCNVLGKKILFILQHWYWACKWDVDAESSFCSIHVRLSPANYVSSKQHKLLGTMLLSCFGWYLWDKAFAYCVSITWNVPHLCGRMWKVTGTQTHLIKVLYHKNVNTKQCTLRTFSLSTYTVQCYVHCNYSPL